ncbi:hypothetical protein ACO0SA_004854 [Hanseniaspora valbyensis]
MLQEINLLADSAMSPSGNTTGATNHSINPLDIFENVMDFNIFNGNTSIPNSDLPVMDLDYLKNEDLLNPFDYNSSSSTVSPTSSMSELDSIASTTGFVSPTMSSADLALPIINAKDIDLDELLASRSTSKKVTKERSSSRASSSTSSISTVVSAKEKQQALKKLNLTPYQPKQRKQALPEIVASEISDPVEAKRAKNTEAARRSRARKMQRMNELEDRVSQLLKENELLKQRLAQYE